MRGFRSQKVQLEKFIQNSKFELFRQLPSYNYHELPYSSRSTNILRDLLNPVYPLAKNILPDKMFYETWANINPNRVKTKLRGHVKNYDSKEALS